MSETVKKSFLDSIASVFKALKIRWDSSPIETVDSFIDFVHTRTSYISQTTLHGYLKARMGTKYRDHFQNPDFAPIIRVSSIKVFASCLGDMTIHAVARLHTEGGITKAQAQKLAGIIFEKGLNHYVKGDDRKSLEKDTLKNFQSRIKLTKWEDMARDNSAFDRSQKDLIKFAPVVDDFKEQDSEIVENSIKFKWNNVVNDFEKRLNAPGVAQDLKSS